MRWSSRCSPTRYTPELNYRKDTPYDLCDFNVFEFLSKKRHYIVLVAYARYNNLCYNEAELLNGS